MLSDSDEVEMNDEIDRTEQEFLQIYESHISKDEWRPILTTLETLSMEKNYFFASVYVTFLCASSGLIGPRDENRFNDYLNYMDRQFYQNFENSPKPHHQNTLGVYYYVKQDYTKAFTYFNQAAQQGDTSALVSLGRCYNKGIGVKMDPVKANEYFFKSSEKGNLLALFNLGVQYQTGRGVEKDLDKAFKYYSMVAEAEHPAGVNNLGMCYEKGLGTTIDLDKAISYYRQAAEQGYDVAQNNLGRLYMDGIGVTKDLDEAQKWFTLAARQRNEEAKNNLLKCQSNEPTSTQPNENCSIQ